MGADVAQQELVAVGRRLGDAHNAQRAATAADVVDHNLLAQRRREAGTEQPCHGILRSTGGIWNDQGHGSRRPRLRYRRVVARTCDERDQYQDGPAMDGRFADDGHH
jgi:hypothetical protein